MCYLLKKKNKLKRVPRVLVENKRPGTSCSNSFLPRGLKSPDCYDETQEGVPQGQERWPRARNGLRRPAVWNEQTQTEGWSAGLRSVSGTSTSCAKQLAWLPLPKSYPKSRCSSRRSRTGPQPAIPGGMGSSTAPNISYHWLIPPKSRTHSFRIIT